MNRPIRKVTIAFAVLFVALFVNLNVVQVVKGSDYRNNANNRRVLLNEYASPRGQIVVQGTNIAESVKTSDELRYLRKYPAGPVYAPATGFYSFIYGSSGIEGAQNGLLSGDDSRLFTNRLSALLTGRNPTGGSVDLTLNRNAQNAAYQAMRTKNGQFKRGAVVALDPRNGKILALVSTPSYDPNALASHDSNAIVNAYQCYSGLSQGKSVAAQIAARKKDCKDVPNDPTAVFAKYPDDPGPMFDRALSGTYPPGSIFKIIDSAAAINTDLASKRSAAKYTSATSIPAPNYYWPLDETRTSRCPSNLSGACIENFEGEACQNGRTATLLYAFAKSCNTAFAKLAVDALGARALAAQARKFGLDTAPHGTPLPVATSTIGSLRELSTDNAALAQTAFGQRNARVTPLQAAELASAVANNGLLMRPYLIDNEKRPNLSTLSTTQSQQQSQVIDTDLDPEIVKLMEGVVSSPEGTGHPAQVTRFGSQVVVGGKTGTADVGATSASKIPPDAWFTGFAMVKGVPRIAVAVLVENGGVAGNEATGGLAAGPIAKKVMTEYLTDIGVHR
ncbi:penicillin-binding transpeptidase domain-containing protein [uncultured Jatrophihabitans sp.]|uniref:penicillin-binding transpeptidase domain-containing protein n=1 Tax=uncultured Jatrophihabitans sp. TaxID=1610747 RepID=UPI0035CBF0AC